MDSVRSSAEAPWQIGVRAARHNFWPGLVLQIVALAIVVAFYRHEPTRLALERLAQFRVETGFVFGIFSTGIVGGLIPLLYLKSRRATRDRYTWSEGGGLVAFWAYKGIEVEVFYRFLARLFGEHANLPTIASKMAVDQFIYCPLFAVPVTVFVYDWIGDHYRLEPVLNDVRAGQWYRRRVLPVLLSNLGVWVPAVCIIYALPTPLQLPLQNLVLCFFTLLLAHVTERPT
jgi:hypothetical protein